MFRRLNLFRHGYEYGYISRRHSHVLLKSNGPVGLFRDQNRYIEYSYNNKEHLTLYIKGFMSKGENMEDYTQWIKSHDMFVMNGLWKEGPAKGWNWHPVKTSYPVPAFTTLKIGSYIGMGSKFFRFTPMTIALAVGIDIGLYASKLTYEYHKIHSEMDYHSKKLARTLVDYSDQYKKVRIVSHSLGCKILLEAMKLIPEEAKPDSIHLCAPAITIGDILEYNSTFAKDNTYIYHAENDMILSMLYSAVNGFVKKNEIVGVSGINNDVLNSLQNGSSIHNINCTEYFSDFWFVHTNYAENLHKIYEMHVSKKNNYIDKKVEN